MENCLDEISCIGEQWRATRGPIMGKARNGGQKGNKPQVAKAIKEGKVTKNKPPQTFKQTPKGKVALINGKKNGNSNIQKKILDNSPQKSKLAPNSPDKKKANINAKVNSPKKPSPQKKNKNKNKNKAKATVNKEEDSDEEDINEGISIEEQVSLIGEDDDDSSDGDEDVSINICGTSLAEDSDEDDEDYQDESDDEVANKGVKMFKGIGSTKKSSVAIKAKGDDEDDDDEDDDDEDEDDEEDEDDDDDDEDDEDETNDISANITASSLNTSGDSTAMDVSTGDDDDDDDEDEDEDEDDDDDDDDDESPGLKALLGQSLIDDEDDEDFKEDSEDEDDDEIDDSEEDDEDDNDSQSENNLSKNSISSEASDGRLSAEEKAAVDRRTIFIGNVPKDSKESRIRGVFKKFGPIESLRIRGVVPSSPKLPYKVAAITHQIHTKVPFICLFIVYGNEESAKAALAMNGKKLDGNYLRVDLAGTQKEYEPKKTIFIGNIPFDTEDNELWEIFGKCGQIEYVRTIRDRKTGLSRGICYVCFTTEDAVALALDLNGTKLRTRELRVTRYAPTGKSPKTANKAKRPRHQQGKNSSPKKSKTEEIETATQNSINAVKRVEKKAKRSQGQKQRNSNEKNGSFQGQKAETKKGGKKFNKFEKKKKAMAGKLTAKPKKSVA
ncbi:hypothetical protein PV325_001729 [Microctonus aethiopoides]|nr:hypothetical protein PV325_001729 [Microctonus aethiopoides]